MHKIGFIGLGNMGMPMALGLQRAGHLVQGFDLYPQAIKQFQEHGGQACTDLKTLAHTSEVIITMLPNPQALLDIYHPSSIFIDALPPKTLLIDCSTVGPLAARQWHQIAQEHHLESVDAPVSGGVVAAMHSNLSFMLGGDESAVQQSEYILAALGKKFIRTGGPGSGQAAKICNNLVLANNMLAVSEAFILAKHLNLPPEKLLEVLQCSSGNSWVVDKYLPVPDLVEDVPANHDYQAGFTSQMMLKDLNLALDAQPTLHLTQETQKIYQQLVEQNLGDKDFSYIYQFVSLI